MPARRTGQVDMTAQRKPQRRIPDEAQQILQVCHAPDRVPTICTRRTEVGGRVQRHARSRHPVAVLRGVQATQRDLMRLVHACDRHDRGTQVVVAVDDDRRVIPCADQATHLAARGAHVAAGVAVRHRTDVLVAADQSADVAAPVHGTRGMAGGNRTAPARVAADQTTCRVGGGGHRTRGHAVADRTTVASNQAACLGIGLHRAARLGRVDDGARPGSADQSADRAKASHSPRRTGVGVDGCTVRPAHQPADVGAT